MGEAVPVAAADGAPALSSSCNADPEDPGGALSALGPRDAAAELASGVSGTVGVMVEVGVAAWVMAAEKAAGE